MKISIRRMIAQLSLSCIVATGCLGWSAHVQAQLVPGTGTILKQVGDDFEDPEWEYFHRGPKSSEEIDGQMRAPTGESKNDRWFEGAKRGHPDGVKRVDTPPGGLPGSKGSLLLQSLQTGIPGRPSYKMQQEDFIGNVQYRVGTLSVSRSPSVVTRVFLPPVDEWENRTGPTFAFRLALTTTVNKQSGRGLFSSTKRESETYWPGLFLEFVSKDGGRAEDDYAWLRVRSNNRGGDFKGMQVEQTGWWTMGLSVTPDGAVHYYAKPGLDDLTPDDHITSQYPYGYRAEGFKAFFFNVCNGDDGRTWSTPWIVDDTFVYVAR
ncbi:MAG: hypothetical protein KDA59_16930 [Planctomycetales bacterium]|nr:hypothetical protein [Planctomycetales bacterium]